jgi:glutamyl-tRNA synthetase
VAITETNVKNADGMVLIKSDGSPSYNFATVVDDIDMDINYIIRGNDHTTNTSRQVILFDILGKPLPKFAHVGLIAIGNKPLSKREGAAGISYYRDKGYDVEAFLNFLARLGWSCKEDGILPKERMLAMFLTEGKMKANMANLDLNKLEAFDRKYKAQKGIWRNKDKLIV